MNKALIMRTLSRVGMLELCKFPMKSRISRFCTQSYLLEPPCMKRVSEIEEPHMRLLGPWSYEPPLPVVPRVGYWTNRSKPDDPSSKNSNYRPLPKSALTGNPCLDLFLFAGRGACTTNSYALLDLAWNHNPSTTLKLILYMTKIPRHKAHHRPLLWLYHKHPKTLACNLRSLAECGYLKYLHLLLFELLQSEYRMPVFDVEDKVDTFLYAYYEDGDYRFLYNQISDLFSAFLKSDLDFLKSGNLHKISPAAKCCPSLNSFFDYTTCMCESIARRLFPKDSDPVYKQISEPHYAYRVRDRLRKEVIAPLRRALNSPKEVPIELFKETLMTHNKDRQAHNEALLACNRARNMNSRNRAKIPVEELLPHKIMCSFYDGGCAELANLQWKKMIEHLTMRGKFKNCLACCDVSPSMSGFCTTVSIALGLLISDLSQGPWRGKIMTFSHDPQLQRIEGDDLQSRTDFMEVRMDWGLKIDLRKVFLHILEVAAKGNINEDNTVKTVFVFTTMDFSETCCPDNWDNWDIEYQEIRNKFHESGYTSLPVIVFWNLLRDDERYSFVREFHDWKTEGYDLGLGLVPNGPQGVTLIKGFSDELLRLAIENNGVLSPAAVMEMVLSDKRYEKVVVCD